MLGALKRGRLQEHEFNELMQADSLFSILTDSETAPTARIAELARTHQLSAYDASYLELAIRRNLPLASLDAALVRAAKRAGVAVFE